MAGMRKRGDEEIEARVQGIPQATLQVMAHVHLEAGVIAISKVGASGERHPDRDGTSTRATRSRPTLPPVFGHQAGSVREHWLSLVRAG